MTSNINFFSFHERVDRIHRDKKETVCFEKESGCIDYSLEMFRSLKKSYMWQELY